MRRALVPLAVAAAAALAVALGLFLLQRAPTGPVEPAWDRQPCAHCRMHLSEPGFAAQLRTADGEVFFFDDPGCLFLWQAGRGEAPAAVYFHDLRAARWLAEADAGFVRVAPTPMAWGYGAVARAEPGAIAPADARRAVLAAAGAGASAGGEGPDGRPAR